MNKPAAKTNVPSLVINTNAVDMSLDTALVNLKNLVNKNKDIHINNIFKNKKNIVLKCDSVLDVRSMTEDGIIEDIKSRNNLCEAAELKVVYEYKNSYKNYWNIIIEVNGAAYSNIMENKRIFFASNSCRVYNDFNISFCTKCCNYWHKAKKCRNINTIVCTSCAADLSKWRYIRPYITI